jgi:hypothetical protein
MMRGALAFSWRDLNYPSFPLRTGKLQIFYSTPNGLLKVAAWTVGQDSVKVQGPVRRQSHEGIIREETPHPPPCGPPSPPGEGQKIEVAALSIGERD